MARKWYIHKFYRGDWISAHNLPGEFDDIDRLCAQLTRIHGLRGWSYEITDSPLNPRARADVDAPMMIA